MGKLCTYPQLCSRSRISGWPSAMPSSDTLRTLWLSAPPGRLSPWQQAKALALREVSRGLHNGRTQLEWIAARVEKVGGGCPRKPALHQFFKLVGADPEWFPGKHKVGKRGRPPLLTPAKRRHIGNSAMAAKHTQGDEPCVAAVVHACPRATLNPETSLPFCGKTILKVFSKDCYDYVPDHPGVFRRRFRQCSCLMLLSSTECQWPGFCWSSGQTLPGGIGAWCGSTRAALSFRGRKRSTTECARP